MKKLTVLTVLFFSLVINQHATAQVNISVNFGTQPTWGPVGYDYVDYYYMPDIDVYYHVPQRRFIYLQSNRWVFASALPSHYHGYNLYNGYKVVVNEPKPYLRADIYRVKYGKFKGGKGPRQVIIRDSHDERYHNKGKSDNGHKYNSNGNKKGHGKHN